MHYEEIWN